MKVSDYVADFLAKQGIKHAFVLTGGAAAHIIDSIAKNPDIDYICTQHEQAAAMAADGYSRATGNLGVAVATSGPGATNLLTGVACSYCDSIPTIYITGQVVTSRIRRNSGVRQLGFQEAPTVDIYKPITNYAVLIEDKSMIGYELGKAVYMARSGRPGPVVVDIPDDIQRDYINPDELELFSPPENSEPRWSLSDKQKDTYVEFINSAKRPVIVLGWGVVLAKAEKEAKEFIEKLGFPVLPTWAALSMLPSSHPLIVGPFGQHGTRYGNLTVQNSDLLIMVGTRLDTHATGSNISSFARDARKIVADIDYCELLKYESLGLHIDMPMRIDAKAFFSLTKNIKVRPQNISKWWTVIEYWRGKYPICPPEYYQDEEVNPYVFTKALAAESAVGDVFFVDTGNALAWTMQAFEFRGEQRLFSAFNNTPMGYSLPASIGACFALGKKPVTCITGDGGLQINIQELATIAKHKLPIKIFLINNRGYSMLRQTQEQWFDARYEASTPESGLPTPDFVRIAEAYGIEACSITTNKEVNQRTRDTLDTAGPAFCNVEINPSYRLIPQVKFGRPIEDSEPLLDRKEFLENMIVKPMEVSLED